MSKTTVDPNKYTEDYFLEKCGGYEFFKAFGNKILKPSMRAAVRAAKLEKSHKILDVGCGRGELIAHLTDLGYDAKGIDYAKEAIDIAKKLHPKAHFELGRIDEKVGEAETYDRIFFLGTIEHLYDPEIQKTLETFCTLLKPGGQLLMTTCTNRLYYKTLTYPIRLWIARFFNKLGLKMKLPTAMRSEDDLSMHINEQHYFSLKNHLKKRGGIFTIKPRPNPKLATDELYGRPLPPGFPVRAASSWNQRLYKIVFFWFPLNLLLARSYLIIWKK